MTGFQESIHDVAADKPGAPDDEDFHVRRKRRERIVSNEARPGPLNKIQIKITAKRYSSIPNKSPKLLMSALFAVAIATTMVAVKGNETRRAAIPNINMAPPTSSTPATIGACSSAAGMPRLWKNSTTFGK